MGLEEIPVLADDGRQIPEFGVVKRLIAPRAVPPNFRFFFLAALCLFAELFADAVFIQQIKSYTLGDGGIDSGRLRGLVGSAGGTSVLEGMISGAGVAPFHSAKSVRALKVLAIKPSPLSEFWPWVRIRNLFFASSTESSFALTLIAKRSLYASLVASARTRADCV